MSTNLPGNVPGGGGAPGPTVTYPKLGDTFSADGRGNWPFETPVAGGPSLITVRASGDVTGATDKANILAAIAALPAPAGGTILLPDPTYYLPTGTGVTWNDRQVTIVGCGSGSQPSAGTRIVVAAGGVGFNPQNGASGFGARSGIASLRLIGSDTAPGTNDGILLQCNEGWLRNVDVEGFGQHGVHILSTGAVAFNANSCRLDHVRVASNHVDGLHVEGTDSNAGVFAGVDASSNTGWGYYENGSLGNFSFGLTTASNGAGGFRVGASGQANHVYGYYNETDANPAVQLDAGGGGANVIFCQQVTNAGGTRIVDNTGASNLVLDLQGGLHFQELFIGSYSEQTVILKDKLAQMLGGAQLQFQDSGVTQNWYFQALAAGLELSAAQALPFIVQNLLQGPYGVQTKIANTTGLTSAQIDALFTQGAPTDGCMLVDTTNFIFLVRAGGHWYKTAVLTEIA